VAGGEDTVLLGRVGGTRWKLEHPVWEDKAPRLSLTRDSPAGVGHGRPRGACARGALPALLLCPQPRGTPPEVEAGACPLELLPAVA